MQTKRFDVVRLRTSSPDHTTFDPNHKNGSSRSGPQPGETGVVAGCTNTGYQVRFFNHPGRQHHIAADAVEYIAPASGQQLDAVGLFEAAWDAGLFTLSDDARALLDDALSQ